MDTPLVIWKIASGFLHGNSSIMRRLSDVEQVSDWQEGLASFQLTPKWALIAGSMVVCVRELRRLDGRVNELSTTDYAGRVIAPG